MANNKLNVLVGATLAQNVETSLNKELKKLNLNSLQLKAEFNEDFKNIINDIQKAVRTIDFGNVKNEFKSSTEIFKKMSIEAENFGNSIKTASKVVTDLNGNVVSTQETLKDIDGTKVNIKVNYDEDGNKSGLITTSNNYSQDKAKLKEYHARLRWAERDRKEEEKAERNKVAKEEKAVLESIEKQKQAQDKYYKARLKWAEQARKEEEKTAKQNATQVEKTYSLSLKASEKIYSLYNKYGYSTDQNGKSFLDVSKINEFTNSLKLLDIETTEYENDAKRLINIQSRLNKLIKEASDYDVQLGDQIKIDDMVRKWNSETDRNVTRLRSQYGDLFNESEYRKRRDLESEINKIIQQEGYNLNECVRAKNKLVSASNEFTTNLSASKKEIISLNKEAQLLNTSLGRFVQFYAFGELFRGVKTLGVNMFETIKDVDTSMVELKKVTDETSETYSKFLDSSAEKAKELGITMTDYIDSVTNFARMDVGGFEAAQQVAEVANIFQQVSESLTADQASEYLISTMKAFGYEANNAIEIVDVLNNLSNKYAITIDGLGESLTRSGAAMRAANNSLEETTALTIAANNVIQDPKSVGNALKTISIDELVA